MSSDQLAIVQDDRVIVFRYDERFGQSPGGGVHVQVYNGNGMSDGIVGSEHLTAVVELFQHAAARAAEIKLQKSEASVQVAPVGGGGTTLGTVIRDLLGDASSNPTAPMTKGGA